MEKQNQDIGEATQEGAVPYNEDKYVDRWLSGTNPRTRTVYEGALRAYLKYTKLTPQQLIEEACEDLLRPITERRNIVEERIRGFFVWLQTEYQRKRKGKIKGEKIPLGERPSVQEKGVSPSLAKTYCGAIMGFYRANNYRVNVKANRDFKALPKHIRFNWTVDDIRKMVNHAKTLRDRAIILVQFQSGADDSTICSLNIGHVRKELKENKIPLRLDLQRGKERLPYITFIARDGVEALKAYLQERMVKEGRESLDDFREEEPLFIVESWNRKALKRIKPRHIQAMFRNIALEAGLISKEYLENNHWNPARAHALRSAFASLLRSAGVNEQDINFMMGHKIPYQQAYYQQEGERLRKTYADAMHVLSIFETKEITEIEARLSKQIQEQNTIISNLVARNEQLEARLQTFESFIDEFNRIKAELQFLKEGGILVGALKKLTPEELKEVLEIAKQKLEK
jgi:site-specific recombinase XerD/chaperonin cofactor prefoldin